MSTRGESAAIVRSRGRDGVLVFMGDIGPGDSSESWAKCDIRIPPLADHAVGVIVCVHWGQISPQGVLVCDHSVFAERTE